MNAKVKDAIVPRRYIISTTPNSPIGLFFTLQLTLHTEVKNVNGFGDVKTEDIEPVINIPTEVFGYYKDVHFTPDESRVFMSITGYKTSIYSSQTEGDVSTLREKNIVATLTLNHSMDSGYANFTFKGDDHEWHEVNFAHVELINIENSAPVENIEGAVA